MKAVVHTVRVGVLMAAVTLALPGMSRAADTPAEVAAPSPAGAAAPDGPRLRVAVWPIASAVDWKGDHPTGVMVDLWAELAGRLGVATDYVRAKTFVKLLEMLPADEADLALGPIAITAERERLFDLTHPIFHSGQRIAVRQRNETGLFSAIRSLVSWTLLELAGAVLALALLSGHLLWWFERRGNPKSFPEPYLQGVWEAIWWIASTIITGGCDDKHLDSPLGRAIGYCWMIGGIVLVATFTSLLTATMTAERVAGAIHGPRDLAGRVVGCQAGAVTVQSIGRRGGVPQEFQNLNDALDALELGMIEAVVSENQSLMYLVNQRGRGNLRVVGPIFDAFDFGFGVPADSPLRERINTAILQMREDGTLPRIMENWFGKAE